MRRRGRGYSLVPSGGAIDTHREVVISLAGFEDTGVVVCGHVPEATHEVVDVLAVPGGVGAGTSPEAELVVRYETCPLVVLQIVAKTIAENETTNRIAIPISTMRVELPSFIAVWDVDLCKVTYTGHLHVIRCLDEVDTFQCTIGNGPGSTT